MNIFIKSLRRIKPKFYIKIHTHRTECELHELQLKLRTGMSTDKEKERENRLHCDLYEYSEWARAIEDKELLKKAGRIGVYLDEIPFIETDKENMRNIGQYGYIGEFGDHYLRSDFRKLLVTAIRVREPIYKKEQREKIEFYIKLVTTVATAITGMVGTAIGLLAVTVTKK